MKYLQKLAEVRTDIIPIQQELEEHPQLWNQHTLRTEGYAPAHNEVSDIWVRYNVWDEYLRLKQVPGMPPDVAVAQFVCAQHESVWYPASDHLPCLKSFIFEAMRYWEVERLGGVLITRIPPGGSVAPHVDGGWHAGYYEKIALQIQSAPGQTFCFEDGEFECDPGTVYSFDNNHTHWVSNRSAVERITAIICVRRDQRLKPLSHAPGD